MASTTSQRTAQTTGSSSANRNAEVFRPDIDGLRALAILAVVGFHAHIPGFGGGFVGVDVFFVVSGYLITRNLLAEASEFDRIGLLAFWAKRIRRLVPALALVLIVVLILMTAVQNPLVWENAASQARAAALYVSNLTFANESADYFGSDLGTSPFLHTWSLGVEEQFYLLWPLAIALACLVARRTGIDRMTVVGVGFAVTTVASAALALALTARGTPYAFFSLPTRAWEFAAAGMLVVLECRSHGVERSHRRARLREGAGVGGVAVLAFAVVALSDQVAYPGFRAWLPVGAALLLVWAGNGLGARATGDDDATVSSVSIPVTSRLLAAAPLQWIGRMSYSWYLWHWPLIVLAVAAFDDHTWVRASAAVAALPVAVATHHLVENRVRFAAGLIASTRRTYLIGALATSAVFLTAGTVAWWGAEQVGSSALLSELRDLQVAGRKTACSQEGETSSGGEYCIGGAVESATTVFLVGDSHARHWQHAFEEAAATEGIRLVVLWQGNCPAVPVVIIDNGVPDAACERLLAVIDEALEEIQPDGIVVASANGYSPERIRTTEGSASRNDQEMAATWTNAYRALLEGLRARGVEVGVVLDNPTLEEDPLACIAEHLEIAPCVPLREDALRRGSALREAERGVLEDLSPTDPVPTFDALAAVCPPGPTCPLVVDGNFVYVDGSHLSEEHTEVYLPEIRALLRELEGK